MRMARIGGRNIIHCTFLVVANISCFCILLSFAVFQHHLVRSSSRGSKQGFFLSSVPHDEHEVIGEATTKRYNDDDLSSAYSYAKYVRAVHGHDAAVPIYQDLLHRNPHDKSAASRIAASTNANTALLSRATTQDIRAFARVLQASGYNAFGMHRLFGAPVEEEKCTATGPIYARPVTSAYPSKTCPFTFLLSQSNNKTKTIDEQILVQEESIKCLTSLFILGFSLSKDTLVASLVGSNETVVLMERLGLIYPCSVDPSLMIPCMSIFPLDIKNTPAIHVDNNHSRQLLSLFFVTDWHPTVLGTTIVGTEGSVMYIGPDSLALVAHWPLILPQDFILKHRFRQLEEGTSNFINVLDLCCGSGVQACCTVSILKSFFGIQAKASCVDINKRALEFTRFNAVLNDLDNFVETLEGDVINWDETIMNNGVLGFQRTPLKDNMSLGPSSLDHIVQSAPFHIILANPPFIPVPQFDNNTNNAANDEESVPNNNSVLSSDTISKRYGLFSSGGANGEDVLQSIIRVVPLISTNSDSVVAIVSEFMNPDFTLTERIDYWWSVHQHEENDEDHNTGKLPSGADHSATSVGIVFTNQFPTSADLYASRRGGNDEQEKQYWWKHLERAGIHSVSPGLLFIYQLQLTDQSKYYNERSSSNNEKHSLYGHHVIVPKSNLGSVWTPHNYEAVNFAIEKSKELLSALK